MGCVIYYLICGYAPFYAGWKDESDSWPVGAVVWAKYSADDRWYEAQIEEVSVEGGLIRVSFNGFDKEYAEWKDSSQKGNNSEIERLQGENEAADGEWELQSLYDDICAANYEFKAIDSSHVDPSSKHLVRCLLEIDPTVRATASQAADHPWLLTAAPSKHTAEAAASIESVGNELDTLVLSAPIDAQKCNNESGRNQLMLAKNAKRKKGIVGPKLASIPLSTLGINTSTPIVRALQKKKRVNSPTQQPTIHQPL